MNPYSTSTLKSRSTLKSWMKLKSNCKKLIAGGRIEENYRSMRSRNNNDCIIIMISNLII